MVATTGHHTREISENPGPNSVTSPTSAHVKAVDTDRKIKLLGVLEAFRQGKLPSNEQSIRALDYAIEHSPIDERKLSKDGRNLVEDAREIVRVLRQIVAEKNDDELIQNFYYHTQQTNTPSLNAIKDVSTGTDKGQIKDDANQAVEHLRTLGKLIFTNSEARKLLKDVGLLGRDVAADAAVKAAETARPSDEQLRQVDEPAPSNQWVGPNGETRDHRQSVPDTGLAEKRDQLKEKKDEAAAKKDELKDKAQDKAGEAQQQAQQQTGVHSLGDAANKAQSAANQASNSGSSSQQFGQQQQQQYGQQQQQQYGQQQQYPVSSGNGQPAYFTGGVEPLHSHSTQQGGFASATGPAYGQQEVGYGQQQQQGFSSGDAQQGAQQAKEQAQQGKEEAKGQAKGAVNNLLNKIPDEHKDRLVEQKDRTKDYLHDKFPQERQDRFIYRLKKVVVENQKHKDYQEAIDFFLDKAEHYQVQAKTAGAQSGGTAASVKHDENFQQAWYELQTLLERFANGQSMNSIFQAVDQIYTDAQNDGELRAWFRELNSYIRTCLQEPGYIMKDESDRRGRELKEQGKRFWDPQHGKYAGHKDRFFDEIQSFFSAYADDGLNQRLGESVKTLFTDLIFNSEGNLQYKPHLWKDIRSVILPALFQQIGYIPIPRAEYSSKEVDLVIENLTLETANLLPNLFEIEARNYFKLSPYDNLGDVSKHSFWISFSQVQCDFKDVAFYINKKTGFPKIKDSGYADVFLGGKGLSGKIHVESTGRKNHAFKVIETKIKIDKLKFAVREAKHSTLINFLRPLATGLIKTAVTKAIEVAIRAALEQADQQISDILERIEDANSEEGTNKIDALKAHFNDKKQRAEATKNKVQDKAPDGKFAITLNPDEALVDWHAKDSILEKVAVKKDQARKPGHRDWASPAFDIVGPAAHNSGQGRTPGSAAAPAHNL